MKPWLNEICECAEVLSPADNQASDAAYEQAYAATMKLGCFDFTPEVVLELVACLIERCEALEALVAALPTTADGVPITPAIRVYRPITIRGRNEVQESKPFYWFATFDSIADGEPVIGPVYINPSLCYSSREAAEKARDA